MVIFITIIFAALKLNLHCIYGCITNNIMNNMANNKKTCSRDFQHLVYLYRYMYFFCCDVFSYETALENEEGYSLK